MTDDGILEAVDNLRLFAKELKLTMPGLILKGPFRLKHGRLSYWVSNKKANVRISYKNGHWMLEVFVPSREGRLMHFDDSVDLESKVKELLG